MSTATTQTRRPLQDVAESAFARGAARLDDLVAMFGLDDQARLIGAAYVAICDRSLTSRADGPAASSRLNADGTPLQFATVVGPRPAPLRLVADPGVLNHDGGSRMRDAFGALSRTAELLGAEAELSAVRPLLAELAPQHAAQLRAEPAGALWVGTAFAPGAVPRLRVYLNGAWGSPETRGRRIRRFTEHFGRADQWDDLEAQFPLALSPLGLSLTLTPGKPLRGAIYLRAFGLRVSDYANLALAASGHADADRIRAFGAALLGDGVAHPAPSAALSFHFGPEPGLPTELEFCAHCTYRDDVDAQAQLERLFDHAGLESAPYHHLVRALAPSSPRPGPPRLHAFIGTPAKGAGPAYSVYVKPDLS